MAVVGKRDPQRFVGKRGQIVLRAANNGDQKQAKWLKPLNRSCSELESRKKRKKSKPGSLSCEVGLDLAFCLVYSSTVCFLFYRREFSIPFFLFFGRELWKFFCSACHPRLNPTPRLPFFSFVFGLNMYGRYQEERGDTVGFLREVYI